MNDLKISEIMKMQEDLYELNKKNWNPLESEYGKDSFLWMIEEIGECIAIIKKKGHDEIVNNLDVRNHFIEEMADVLMYYSQILLRFGISAEELAETTFAKHQKNINRNYQKEYMNK